MNKSKIAYEIINDIYTLNQKYQNLKAKFESNQIDKTEFSTNQYVILTKLAYLEEVVKSLKDYGYKFTKFQKELIILSDLQDEVEKTYKPEDFKELTSSEQFGLVSYLSKYEEVVEVIEFEELNENITENKDIRSGDVYSIF